MQNALLFGERTNPEDGLGRLAQTLADNVDGLIPASVSNNFDESAQALVHSRRHPQLLPSLIEHCQRTGQPLLNLGTGFEVDLPPELNFLYLECSNVCLEAVDFKLRILERCKAMTEPFFLYFTEHHQPSKQDRSGTAVSLIDEVASLPLSRNPARHYHGSITSVRNLAMTRSAGFEVPPEHEQGYAIHEASILAASDGKTLEPLEIYGRETYADGLSWILQTLGRIEPITGRLLITDFRNQYR